MDHQVVQHLFLMKQEEEIKDLKERVGYLESFIKLGGEEIN